MTSSNGSSFSSRRQSRVIGLEELISKPSEPVHGFDDTFESFESARADLLALGIDLDEQLIQRLQQNLGVESLFSAAHRSKPLLHQAQPLFSLDDSDTISHRNHRNSRRGGSSQGMSSSSTDLSSDHERRIHSHRKLNDHHRKDSSTLRPSSAGHQQSRLLHRSSSSSSIGHNNNDGHNHAMMTWQSPQEDSFNNNNNSLTPYDMHNLLIHNNTSIPRARTAAHSHNSVHMGPGPYPGLGKPGRQLLEFLNKEYWRNSDLFSRRLHGGALLATQKSADHHQQSTFRSLSTSAPSGLSLRQFQLMLANLISECEPPGTSSGATARNTTLPQSSAAVKKLLKGAAAAELFHYLQQHATDGRTSPVKNSAPISTNSGNHTNTSFPLEYNKISLKNGRVADENAAISSPSASSPSRGVSSLALLNLLKHAADDSRRSFDLRTSQTALNNQFWRKEDTAPPAPSHESFEYRHQHRIPTKQHHKISSVSNHSIFHNNSSNSGETEVMPSSMLAASPNNEVVFGRTTAAVSKQQGNVATLLGQQSSSCISNNASSTAKSTMKSNRSRGLLQSEESLVCGVKTGNNVSSALNSSVLPTNSSPRRRVMKSHEDETRTRFAIDFNSVDFLRGSQMKELIRSKEVESASMYTTSKPLSMCVMMNMEPRVYRSRPHTLQQEFQADRTTVSIALGGGLAK